MAFYGFKGDADECYWTPYDGTADECYWTPYDGTADYNFAPTPVQASSHYVSPYESGESEYNYGDYSFATPPELNYSVYTCSEPKILHYEPPPQYHYSHSYYESCVNPWQINYSETKFLQYEPPPYDRGYFPSDTKFRISYSASEFNEPEFEEYDPTPYGGGYDIVTTYGRPLPPSDLICYPRSRPQSDGISLENFSYGSFPSPYGKEDDFPVKPLNGHKPVDTKTDKEAPADDGGKVTGDAEGVDIVESSDGIPRDVDSYQNGFENEMRGEYGYESERQIAQIPYGYGLESVDLCESIFGYWPCLAKIEQQQRAKCPDICGHNGRMDPWKNAADYLFGSPAGCGYENYYHW